MYQHLFIWYAQRAKLITSCLKTKWRRFRVRGLSFSFYSHARVRHSSYALTKMFLHWLEKKALLWMVFSVSCWKPEAFKTACGHSTWAWYIFPWGPKSYHISWRVCFCHNLDFALWNHCIPVRHDESWLPVTHRVITDNSTTLYVTAITSLVRGGRKDGVMPCSAFAT